MTRILAKEKIKLTSRPCNCVLNNDGELSISKDRPSVGHHAALLPCLRIRYEYGDHYSWDSVHAFYQAQYSH